MILSLTQRVELGEEGDVGEIQQGVDPECDVERHGCVQPPVGGGVGHSGTPGAPLGAE